MNSCRFGPKGRKSRSDKVGQLGAYGQGIFGAVVDALDGIVDVISCICVKGIDPGAELFFNFGKPFAGGFL